MFATLLGALPRPRAAAGLAAAVETAVGAQEAAGLEPLSSGRFGWQRDTGDPDPVAAWRTAAGITDRAVKQALPGPYSVAWRTARGPSERARIAQARARELNAQVLALAAAGCPMVEIE